MLIHVADFLDENGMPLQHLPVSFAAQDELVSPTDTREGAHQDEAWPHYM